MPVLERIYRQQIITILASYVSQTFCLLAPHLAEDLLFSDQEEVLTSH